MFLIVATEMAQAVASHCRTQDSESSLSIEQSMWATAQTLINGGWTIRFNFTYGSRFVKHH